MKRSPLARSSSLSATSRTPLTRSTSRARPPARRNPMPADTHALVVARDHGTCRRCGKPATGMAGSVHHRRPRGMGGTRNPDVHSPALLVLLCGDGTRGCHGWVESHRSEAVLLGWLLSRLAVDIDPQEIPLRWADRPNRLFLHHDGTTTTDLPQTQGDQP